MRSVDNQMQKNETDNQMQTNIETQGVFKGVRADIWFSRGITQMENQM